MLSSIEAHCADGTNLSFLFLYLLIKYASKRSNNSHLIQLLYGQERTLDSILPNNSSFTPFPDPHLLLFREVVEVSLWSFFSSQKCFTPFIQFILLQILRKELKSMIISVSLSETTSIDILRKFCYSLLNTKLDVVLSEVYIFKIFLVVFLFSVVLFILSCLGIVMCLFYTHITFNFLFFSDTTTLTLRHSASPTTSQFGYSHPNYFTRCTLYSHRNVCSFPSGS